nr:hypothetical protein [uncultured Allomuricauda sp.]
MKTIIQKVSDFKVVIFFIAVLASSGLSAQSYNELAVKLDNVDQIKKETIDGKLDYEKILTEKGGSGFYMIRREAYNAKEYAAFLWGLSVKKTGVKSLKEAFDLWKEIKENKPSKEQKKALEKGFNTLIQ